MRIRHIAIFVPAVAFLTVAFTGSAYAQAPTGHVALGITAEQALKPEEALKHFQAALAADSLDYEANWRAAVVAVEVAQKPTNAADSLYALAETYARRALAVDQKRASGHFAVAFVLGSRSLVSGVLARLSMAREIWQEASDAIAADPQDDRAYHILGQWYAEIMRLSPFEADYAKSDLGEIAENATWELALKNLEQAVKVAPNGIYHRLDLARAYIDLKRNDDARAQLSTIETLPIAGVHDAEYKDRAKALLNGLPKTP